MGEFITQTDLEATFQSGDLLRLSTVDGSTATVIDAAVITQCIALSEAVIKSYIQTKYTLPFTTVPTIIKSIACYLTFCALKSRKYLPSSEDKIMYEQQIAILKDIQSEKATLDTAPATNPFQTLETVDGIPTLADSYDEVFTADNLDGLV
jgi:phage gp36-like protein